MTIQEKLSKEEGTHVYCYKQGFFWVCYEQSAYIVSLSKGYKATRKWIKSVAQEVVSIGFPDAALQQWVSEQKVKVTISTEVLKVFEWSSTFLKFSSPQEFQLPPQTAFLYRTSNYKPIVNNGYSVYFKHATPPPEFTIQFPNNCQALA